MDYTKFAIKGFSVLFGATIISSVCMYLLRLILAHNLSLEQFGLVYSIMALFGLVFMVQDFGFGGGMIKFIAEYYHQQKFEKIKEIILTSLVIKYLLLIPPTIIMIILAPWLAENYFHTPGAAVPIMVYAASMLLIPLTTTVMAVFDGCYRMGYHAVMNVLRAIFLLTTTAVLLYFDFNVLAAMIPYVLIGILHVSVYLPLFFKTFPSFTSIKTSWFSKNEAKKLFLYGIPLSISSVSGLILSSLDTVMITYFLGVAQAGLYNAALPTSKLLWTFAGSVVAVLLPLSAQLWLDDDKTRIKMAIEKYYRFITIILLPITVVLIILAEEIITLLFGSSYSGAVFSLQILAGAGLFSTLVKCNNGVVAGIGDTRFVAKQIIGGSVLNTIANFILIPMIGIAGAAIATVISFVGMFGWSHVYLLRKTRFHIRMSFYYKSLVATAIVSVISVVLKRLLTAPVVLELIIICVCISTVYCILLIIMRIITKDEIKMLLRKAVS